MAGLEDGSFPGASVVPKTYQAPDRGKGVCRLHINVHRQCLWRRGRSEEKQMTRNDKTKAKYKREWSEYYGCPCSSIAVECYGDVSPRPQSAPDSKSPEHATEHGAPRQRYLYLDLGRPTNIHCKDGPEEEEDWNRRLVGTSRTYVRCSKGARPCLPLPLQLDY